MKKGTQGSFLSVQFYSFHTAARRLKALGDMGKRSILNKQQPPLFARHLGSGAGEGFSLFPDFGTYAFLSVWDSEEKAQKHLKGEIYQPAWSVYADETLKILLECSQVRGQWGGQQVLTASAHVDESQAMAVLTRAKIKFNKLARFWQFVPQSSRAIKHAKGCYFSKGVGEWPLSTLATISLWKNKDSMDAFAYQNPEHADIIHKVRKEGWFAEEMFARFRIVSVEGSYREFSKENLHYAKT